MLSLYALIFWRCVWDILSKTVTLIFTTNDIINKAMLEATNHWITRGVHTDILWISEALNLLLWNVLLTLFTFFTASKPKCLADCQFWGSWQSNTESNFIKTTNQTCHFFYAGGNVSCQTDLYVLSYVLGTLPRDIHNLAFVRKSMYSFHWE